MQESEPEEASLPLRKHSMSGFQARSQGDMPRNMII